MYICASSKGNIVIYSFYGDDDIEVGCEIFISNKDIMIICKNQKAITSILKFLSNNDKYINIKELLSLKGVFGYEIR